MSRKALSPVVASIILIAVTVAVSIAVAAWMGALSFSFMSSKKYAVHVAIPIQFNATHAVATIDAYSGYHNASGLVKLPYTFDGTSGYKTLQLYVTYFVEVSPSIFEKVGVNEFRVELIEEITA